MTDWFVLLTPLLVLPIFLLFRFVGCDALFKLEPVSPVQPPVPYDQLVTSEPSLVAYWRLGEQNNDPQAHDETGAHPGLYGQPAPTSANINSQGATGEVLQGQPGVRDPASAHTSVDFEGGYVALAFDPALNTASFTIEAWVFPGAWEAGFDHTVVTSAEIEGAAQRGFSVFSRWNSGLQKSFWSAALGTTTFQEITGSEVPMPGSRTYVALTHDGATGRTVLYVSTAPGNWDAVIPAMMPGYTPAQSNHFYIGANTLTLPPPSLPPPPPQTAPPVLVPSIGRIEEVAFYNAALSDATLVKHRG